MSQPQPEIQNKSQRNKVFLDKCSRVISPCESTSCLNKTMIFYTLFLNSSSCNCDYLADFWRMMDLCYIYFMLFLFHQTAGGLDETFFKTIDDLIRHYKRKNQGLAMHLRHSVKRKTALLIQPQRELQAQPSKSPEQRPRRTEREPWRQPDTVPEEEHDYESTPYIFSVSVLFCPISVSQHLLWFVCLTFALFIQMLLSLSTSKSFLINVGHQTPNEMFGGNQ